MNKLFFAGAFALTGAVGFATSGFAQTADTGQTNAVSASQTAAGTAQANRKRAVPPLNSRQCIRNTGSHIPPPKGQCLPVAGSSYSQQDLQRTGATNIGQALQMLDPSVTVHGH